MSRGTRSGADDQIEFLPPRDSVFGGDHPVDFSGIDIDDLPPPDDDTPRSGWLTGAAALAVVALVGVGVVAAAPWESDDSTSPPPVTTIVPPETSVSPVDLAGALVDLPVAPADTTGFVFDPLPSGFGVDAAWSDNSESTQEPPPGWGEVWATSDATATSGVWFSITLLNYRSDIAGNATRVDLDGRTGLLEQLDNGWLRLSAPTNDVDVDRSLSIVSFGLAVDQLTALFTSIMVVETDDAGGVRIGLDTTVLDGLAEGLAPLAMGPTQDDLLQRYLAGSAGSLPGHTSTYYSTGGGATYIAIDTAPRDDSLDAMGHIAVGPIRIFPDTASVPSDFTGEGLVLGVSPGGANHEIVARWDAGDTTVVVHTTMPLADLLPLLPQVRHTTAAEWRVVLRRVNSQTATTSDYQAGGGIDLAGGTLADGSSWSSSWHSPSWVQIRAGTGSFIVSVSSADLAADPLQIVATGSAISVTALVPSDPVPAVLRILDRHRVLIEVPLIEIATIDPASSVAGRVAAVMVQHLGPYEVEVIDANETVIAHFDSPGSQAQGSA